MSKIVGVGFAENRIYASMDDGSTKSRPLEAFPLLMDASDEQRNEYIIWADGQSIRWDSIDEDIHISSFDEVMEPNPDNVIAKMIDSVGVIDLGAFAKMIGMKKTKLDLFRYGIWSPSSESVQKIKDGLRQICSRIIAVL